MNIIYGNIRGIGNNESRIALSELYRVNRPSLIFIAEPMVPYDSIPPLYWRSIHVTKYVVNSRDSLIPNLWAVWGSDCDFTVVFVSSQCLVLEHICRGIKVYIASVYANKSYILRRQLWADLTSLHNTYQAPWIFLGGF